MMAKTTLMSQTEVRCW